MTISDDDTPNQTVTVTLDHATYGTLSNLGSGTYNPGTGTYTVSGTNQAVSSAVDALVFTPTNNQIAPGTTETVRFTIASNDGMLTTSNSNINVMIRSVEDPPTIGGTRANQAVTDKGTAAPFSGATVADPDFGASESVAITVTANGAASDADGLLSGAGLTKTGTGTYTLAAGTPAAVQAALQALVFTPTANQVAPGQTVTTGFALSVSDGIAAPTTDNTTTVVATSVNDAPTITGTSASAQQVNDNATVSPFTAVTVGDVDNPAQTQAVTVTLSAPADGTLSNLGGGSYDATTGVYAFSGTAAAATTALHGLVFTPTDNQIRAGTAESEVFTIASDDGAGGTASDGNINVTITSVDDPPTIAGTTAHQVTNDQTAIRPFSTVAIGDVDADATEAVTITLRAGGVATDADGTLGGDGVTKTGVGTYSVAAGSPQAVQSTLRAATFTPTPLQVPPGQVVSTEFDLSVVDDGGLVATDTTTSVDAKAVPAAPSLKLSDDTGPSGTDRLTRDPAITYTTNMAADSLLYSSDGSPYSTTVPTFATDGSADGQHTVFVEERDTSGNIGPAASLSFVLDTRPPVVSSPSDTVAQNSGPAPIGIAAPTDAGAGSLAIVAGALPSDGTMALADGAPVASGQALSVSDLTGLTFTPATGAYSQSSAFTYSVTDGAGNRSTGTATLAVGGPGNPTIAGTVAGQTTRNEAPVRPFSSATVSDPNAGATDQLTITLAGGGGTLKDGPGQSGLVRTGPNSYSLAAGTPGAVTAELEALVFTPAAGRASQPNTTRFTLTDTSSVGPGTSDAATTVTDTAAPSDTVTFDTAVRYAGNGTFTLTGRAASTAGVASVEISAVVDGGAVQDLGAATVRPDGTFVFSDAVGAKSQGFITATVTDGLGGTGTGQATYSLTGGLRQGPFEAQQTLYTPDGVAVTGTSLFRPDGTRRVDVQAGGQTFTSDHGDTWRNDGNPSTTFVFNPGYGRDVIGLFRVDGDDHDTLSFKGTDFGDTPAGQLAALLDHARDTKAGLVITDPTTLDTVRIGNIKKADLVQNERDITFHA